MASRMAAPNYCIEHSRFTKQDGWRLLDVSLSLNGNIAVTGYNKNTHRTCIDVYTNVRHSDSRDKPKLIYSKEFGKYKKRLFVEERVSFIDDDVLVSCVGYKLKVLQVSKDEVLQSRKLNSLTKCLYVRERREILIGFQDSNKITVYDVNDLKEIKSISLQGIQDCYRPWDMTATADRIFVCVGEAKEGSERKLLIFEEKNGRILSELTKPTDSLSANWYASSVEVNMKTLSLAGVIWRDSYWYKDVQHRQIVFYSLLSETNCSFLIVEVESGVSRIRMSDRGDTMITGNIRTGEVKMYDVAEVLPYSHFKEKLASTLKTNECTKLANLFKIPKDQADTILKSDKPSENLLLAFEENGILQPCNDDKLLKAFDELSTNPFCRRITEMFLKSRPSSYLKDIVKKLNEEVKTLQMTFEGERRQHKENIDALHEKLRKLSEAYQAMTQGRNPFEAERDGNQMQLSSLNEDLQLSKQAHEETRKALQQTAELNQEMTLVGNQFKAERDESQLQLSHLQIELEACMESKAQTEKVLKHTEELLQKAIQDKVEIETQLKHWQMNHSFQSMTLEEKASADVVDGSSQVASPDKSTYFTESLLGDEYGKLIVKVSVKLKKRNCIALAIYFNLP